jgi:hypothetical protein
VGTAEWALAISVVSLGVSGVVAYRAEARGAKVDLKLLAKPTRWEVRVSANQTAANPAGTSTGNLVLLQADDPCPPGPVKVSLFGDMTASIENSGSQDGVLWGLTFILAPLPAAWGGGAMLRENRGDTVAASRKGNAPFKVLVSLSCENVNLPTALTLLHEAPASLTLTAHYTAHRGWFGRARPGITEMALPRDDLTTVLRQWGVAHGANV